MSSAMRRGGIPGPESRTGLTRPTMTEAEFERRISSPAPAPVPASVSAPVVEPPGPAEVADVGPTPEPEIAPRVAAAASPGSGSTSRSRAVRVKPTKPRRVQRMFAIEEDLDKKLWLYAIHVGKDRSDVVNDLLRPIVASMVLYDSRDRRGRNVELAADRGDADESAA
jgi:hypothetical protein